MPNSNGGLPLGTLSFTPASKNGNQPNLVFYSAKIILLNNFVLHNNVKCV